MTGMDTTAFQERVYYSQFLKEGKWAGGQAAPHRATGETQMGQEAKGTREGMEHKPLLWFPRKVTREGKVHSRIGRDLNHFNSL